jgi:hypothetical protein
MPSPKQAFVVRDIATLGEGATSQLIASPSQKMRVSKTEHKIEFRSDEAFGPQQMRVDKVCPSYKFTTSGSFANG